LDSSIDPLVWWEPKWVFIFFMFGIVTVVLLELIH